MHNILHKSLRGVQMCFRDVINRNQKKCIRYLSHKNDTRENIQTFDEVVNDRRKEANRSIVVQVNSEKSFQELFNYCSQFGQIHEAHHYKISHDELHYILIEFENESNANDALSLSSFNEDFPGVPVRSQFLWFKAGKKQKLKKTETKSSIQKELKIIDGVRSLTDIELKDLLQCAENLEDQIQILYRSTCLNDLEIRLRFLAARQVENSISGMFPYANARPFGSSVNGFGKMGCDLDLILRFEDEQNLDKTNSRLIFHTKQNLSNGRSQTQRQMESIGDMLHLFLPGVCHVRRILQARVPIIKFHHEHLNLEVDLSMSNLTGVYMSELLYMFGQLDPRVRPLTFCLRRWAQTVGVTNPSPGRWITNFSLTCLVIFFLQQMKQPILPSINHFVKLATTKDLRITEDGINCTYLRNYNNLNFKTTNKSSINELLLQFFEFYSQFDFHNKAISLNEGRAVIKPDHSSMYIINPLEQVLNVSKNISLEECERFRIEVRNGAWILESELEKNSLTMNDKHENSWGLLNLFKTPDNSIIRPNMFFKPRMVEVTDLFQKDDFSIQENQTEIVEYKNSLVKNEIENIKGKTRSNLKQIRVNTFSGAAAKGIRKRR